MKCELKIVVPNLPSTVLGGDDGDRGLERNNGEELKIFSVPLGCKFLILGAAAIFGSSSLSISRFHF